METSKPYSIHYDNVKVSESDILGTSSRQFPWVRLRRWKNVQGPTVRSPLFSDFPEFLCDVVQLYINQSWSVYQGEFGPLRQGSTRDFTPLNPDKPFTVITDGLKDSRNKTSSSHT